MLDIVSGAQVCGYGQITRIMELPVISFAVKCFFISSLRDALRETAIKINPDNSSNRKYSDALTEDKICKF